MPAAGGREPDSLMAKLISLDEDTCIMADDLARWSGLDRSAAVHQAIKLVWYATTVRDATLKKWLLVMQRARGIAEGPRGHA